MSKQNALKLWLGEDKYKTLQSRGEEIEKEIQDRSLLTRTHSETESATDEKEAEPVVETEPEVEEVSGEEGEIIFDFTPEIISQVANEVANILLPELRSVRERMQVLETKLNAEEDKPPATKRVKFRVVSAEQEQETEPEELDRTELFQASQKTILEQRQERLAKLRGEAK